MNVTRKNEGKSLMQISSSTSAPQQIQSMKNRPAPSRAAGGERENDGDKDDKVVAKAQAKAMGVGSSVDVFA